MQTWMKRGYAEWSTPQRGRRIASLHSWSYYSKFSPHGSYFYIKEKEECQWIVVVWVASSRIHTVDTQRRYQECAHVDSSTGVTYSITVWMFCTVCTDATAGETLDTTELAFAHSRWSPVSHVMLRRKAKLLYTIECLVNDQSVSEREERTTDSQKDTSWTGSIVDDCFGLFAFQLGQFSHFRTVLYLTSNYEKSIKYRDMTHQSPRS